MRARDNFWQAFVASRRKRAAQAKVRAITVHFIGIFTVTYGTFTTWCSK
jgi:hypothetical protein